MLSNYTKTSFRAMKKRPLFTCITIFGLAISLAAFIMIFLYIYAELTTDRCHKNYDNINRVETTEWKCISYPYKALIQETLPGLGTVAMILKPNIKLTYKNETYLIPKSIFTEEEFIDIFTINVLKGDLKETLNDPRKIMLSQAQADRIFGKEDPLEKTVIINNEFDYIVSGIFEDLPENVHLSIPVLSSLQNVKEIWGRKNLFTSGNMFAFSTYVKLNHNIDLINTTKVFNKKINNLIMPDEPEENWLIFQLKSLPEIYYYNNLKEDDCNHGNRQYVDMFILAAILILVVAIINYINLTTARAGVRASEIGIRKTLGASQKNITHQFLSESVLNVLIAVVFSLLLISLLLPYYNNLLQRELSFDFWKNPLIITAILLGSLLVSFLAGLYPALFLSGRKITTILKNQTVHSRKGLLLHKILISIQLIITTSLILTTMVIFQQMNFMSRSEIGFDRENILYFRMRGDMFDHEDTLKEQLLKSPAITKVAFSQTTITGMVGQLGMALMDGTVITCRPVSCDEDFPKLLGLEFIMGENFSQKLSNEHESYIVNESYINTYNIADPLNAELNNNARIVGVVKDFTYQSLRYQVEPMALIFPPKYCYGVNIKMQENAIDEAITHIKSISKQYSEKPVEIKFLDAMIEQQYWREKQFGSLFTIFSIIAIVVSSLGILGMILFESERRTKEIGIRKTMGATTTDILMIFGKQLIVLIAVSCLVSWSVTYLLMERWLQDFAFKTEMSWWLFALSGGITFLITLVTYSSHAIKAARANPVDTLKYE